MKEKLIFREYTFDELKKIILKTKKKISINFLNGMEVDSFTRLEEYKNCFNRKDLEHINNVDSISVAVPLSIKYLRPIKRFQGPTFTDLFLNDQELNKNKKHFFVGIDEENLNEVIKRYPLLKRKNISAYNPPYIKGIIFSEKERKKIIGLINHSKADYVWIGVGSPKQQILTNQIYKKINSNKIFNVGVALQFIQGKKKRAPKFFQSIGLEWLYRLLFSQFRLTMSRLYPTFRGMLKTLFVTEIK